MLAAIFNVNTENWSINNIIDRDGDVEIEDDMYEEEELDEEDEDEEEEESDTKKIPENSDIFRKDEENLTISECF